VTAAVAATRAVPASPADIFEFLSDLENHWLLADRFIEVLELERNESGRAVGGRVRMRGPLGIGRVATTRVEEAQPVTLMRGTAQVGSRTHARVSWTLAPASESTRVRLEAIVDQAGGLDRLLLALGGRVWLARRFDRILETLATRVR
jgi:hypothetical protein